MSWTLSRLDVHVYWFLFLLVNLFLAKLVRISGSFLLFPAIVVFSAHFSEGTTKALRSLRRERKAQRSSLISTEKVNKAQSKWAIRGVAICLQRLCIDLGQPSPNAIEWRKIYVANIIVKPPENQSFPLFSLVCCSLLLFSVVFAPFGEGSAIYLYLHLI